uniref:DNA (cytosine-5-)-methyltransferase n=1 Tax=Neogobius melanostomus TaxID=47308 RepID=A0A8C6SK83_9GOBI
MDFPVALNVSASDVRRYETHELLRWANACLHSGFTHIEQLATGAAFCQLMHILFPPLIDLSRVQFHCADPEDRRHNYSLLQRAFDEKKEAELGFLQWFRAFFEKNKGRRYNFFASSQCFNQVHSQPLNSVNQPAPMSTMNTNDVILISDTEEGPPEALKTIADNGDHKPPVSPGTPSKSALLKELCSQTPYCVYVDMGMELDQTGCTVLIGFFDRVSGVSIVQKLDTLSIDQLSNGKQAPILITKHTANAAADLLIALLKKYELPQESLKVFYCNIPDPEVNRIIVAKLKELSPHVASLGGLACMVGGACQTGLLECYSHVLDLINDIHYFRLPERLTEANYNILIPISLQYAAIIAVIQYMSHNWQKLEDYFKALKSDVGASRLLRILDKFQEHKVRLDFIFLSHALDTFQSFQDLQKSKTRDMVMDLQLTAMLVNAYASSIFTPAAADQFVRKKDMQMLLSKQDLLPISCVNVGIRARRCLSSLSFAELGEEDRSTFLSKALLFYQTTLKMLVESLPGQLSPVSMKSIGTLLKHPHSLKVRFDADYCTACIMFLYVEVCVEYLRPFADFAKYFSQNTFATVAMYKEAVFLALRVTSARCQREFLATIDSKEEILIEMLDWAFGGFKPMGPQGFAPAVLDEIKSATGQGKIRPEDLPKVSVSLYKLPVEIILNGCFVSERIIRRILAFDLDIEGEYGGRTCFTTTNKRLHVVLLFYAEYCLCCGTKDTVMSHPLFKGSLCLECKNNFTETLYRYDEDGYQSYCTICCYGMEVILCGNDSCCRSYCADCLNILVSDRTFDFLKDLDPWICYLCQAEQTHGALTPRQDWSIRVQELFANNSAMEFEPHRVYPSISANLRRPVRVLSLFDGIATGYLVLKDLGFKVETYVASEVCEDSIAVAHINHDGKIIHVGDARLITQEHLDKWGPFDLLIGGSPCNDLSIVNPLRKGLYEGTGRLFFEYYRILQLLKPKEEDPRPFFWLFENVVFMNVHDRLNICRFLECNPVLVDAVRVSPANRSRYFWGNIPGMNRPIAASQTDKLNLQDCLEIGRVARMTKVRTITTNSNSLKQGKNVSMLPVLQNGTEDTLWITEIEKIFGFPKHYTDVRNMNRQQRQKVLGKAWSVPVIRHLFAPLKDYFACEELPQLSTSNASNTSTSGVSGASTSSCSPCGSPATPEMHQLR